MLWLPRFKEYLRASQVSFGGIRQDEHVGASEEISLGYLRRPNDDHLTNARPLGRTQFLPNQPSAVAASRKTVDRSYRAVATNAIQGHDDLWAIGSRIAGHIEHFAFKSQPPRILQC